MEGATATLCCELSKAAPVEWSKGPETLKPGDRVSLKQDGAKCELQIHGLVVADSGEYKSMQVPRTPTPGRQARRRVALASLIAVVFLALSVLFRPSHAGALAPAAAGVITRRECWCKLVGKFR